MSDILNEFASQWCFQLESGTITKHQHYQCRVIMEEGQMKETMLSIFEARSIPRKELTFLPESNNSLKQGGLSFYVMKDESRIAGPWYDASYNPKRKVVYEGKDLKCMDNPRHFQNFIFDDISGDADDRSVNWLVNIGGCTGKSKLMKYMRFHQKRFDMARIPMGSATQIKTCVIAKGPHKCYMVDLPRVRGSDETQAELFSAIEEIKNGWVESAMYGQNQELLMEPPHMWCFSNEWPNPSYCSVDRWKVWILEEDFVLQRASHHQHIDEFTQQCKKRKLDQAR